MTHIDRIAALLAKAERTDNPAEAEAYLAKAQMLATQSSIDLALARASTARREAREQPASRTITIGEPGKRANTHLVSLFITVGQCNDLQMDIARNSTYVIAYGMPTDIDLVETVFASLATQMATSAATWLAVGMWRTDSYITRDGWRRAHTAQTARAAFYRGFIERIGMRLAEAREQVIAAARAADAADHSGAADEPRARERTALALRDKTAEVRSFYRSASEARGSWGGYAGAVSRRGGAATSAGAAAAAAARLGTARAVGRRSGAIADGG
jgi:hypothetical protein